MSPPEIDLDHLCDEDNLTEGDTGKWIFKGVEYQEWWESKESKLLWLCGGPGTGKTTLAKCVAADFLKGLDDSPGRVKMISHFVSPELPANETSADEAELSRSRLAKVASDLLYGILQQDGDLFDGCRAELEKQGEIFFTNPHSLWKVLRKAIEDCKTDLIYILIDGVDELKESLCKDVIQRIRKFMKIRRVKIFLSGQDVPHVSNNLPKFTKIDLDTNSFLKADVETFIRNKVDAWGWDDKQKEKAKEALMAKSEGTFLWASLAIENLACLSSGPDFDAFLEKPPPMLEDVYRKMLRTLCSRAELRGVLDMIWSVALALRPLTFSELSHTLACIEERVRAEQQPSHRKTGSKIQRRTEEEIKTYVKSSRGFLRATNTTVSIVHHTAIKYLFDENRKGHLPVLSKSEADLTVSWACFQYLHQAFENVERVLREDVRGRQGGCRDLGSGGACREEEPGETPREVVPKGPQKATGKWPYLRYAAESWFIHARRSIEISKDKFHDDSARNWLQHQFFEVSDIIRGPWIDLCGDPDMEVLAGEQTPLHIAVCLGLTPLVEKALSDFTQRTKNHQTPLHLAAKLISGAYEILISNSEPSLLTAPDQDGNTPLHEAVISGHRPMLAGLVEKFAAPTCRARNNEINRKNHFGNTPLHLAFQFDHPDIVKLLIDNGADPTIKNNAHVTASGLGGELGRDDSLDVLKQARMDCEGTKKGTSEESVEEAVYQTPGASMACEPAEKGTSEESVEEALYQIPGEFEKGTVERAPKKIGVEIGDTGVIVRESKASAEPLRGSELLLFIFFTIALIVAVRT